jgi:chitinase
VVDDPARNPYPTWQPVEMYQGGYKVVWNGEVYQAKWFSKSSRPGIVVRHPWDTPWLLLGPVLPSDSAPRLPEFPSGTYPAWLPTAVYRAGARVLYQGLPFVAKYYTTGKPPEVEPIDPFTVPWRPLFTIPGEPGASP